MISAAREAGMGPEELHIFVTEPEERLRGALPLDLLRRGWRNPVRSCRRSWTDPIYRIQDDERIFAWWYPATVSTRRERGPLC